MSASSTPTDAPSAASASARFTAVVLLPTPPLPEATAMMFLIPGTSFTPRCTECETTFAPTFTRACAAPDLRSAAITSRRIGSNWLLPG
jgi:hypothetical protein